MTPLAGDLETRIERRLRSRPYLVPVISLTTAAGLYAGVGWCLQRFVAGDRLVVILAGLLVHAYLAVVVHDGSHRAITRTAADSLLMNVGAGLMLVPFFAEPFRRYHLIHHAHANEEVDPLWPPFKRRLYDRHRRLYMLAELVPLLFTVLALLFPAPRTGAPVKGPAIRKPLLALSFGVAIATAVIVRPAPGFVLGTLLSLNVWGALRHWCEHLGVGTDRQSNTFRFPLGMGLGNHAAHHDHPSHSWISMALGLAVRPKDTGPLRTVVAMWRRPEFRPYRPIDQPIDRSANHDGSLRP